LKTLGTPAVSTAKAEITYHGGTSALSCLLSAITITSDVTASNSHSLLDVPPSVFVGGKVVLDILHATSPEASSPIKFGRADAYQWITVKIADILDSGWTATPAISSFFTCTLTANDLKVESSGTGLWMLSGKLTFHFLSTTTGVSTGSNRTKGWYL